MSRSLPALPPATGCRTCGAPGFKLCAQCAAVTDSKVEADWVCRVCKLPTNAYNCVRIDLHRACEALPAVAFNQTGMVEFCDAQNTSRQARLFVGGK